MTITNPDRAHVNRAVHQDRIRARKLQPTHGTTLATTARRALHDLAGGRLDSMPFAVRFWDGSFIPAGDGGANAPAVLVRDRKALSYLLYEPSEVGLARAWVEGNLDVEGDLGAVLAQRERFAGTHPTARQRARLALAAALSAGLGVLRRPPVPSIEARPHGRRHSVARDRASVRHHYELSNRFYELMLGASMVYSCAYFEDGSESLERAQERKLETICRKLRLAPGERLLDVGCGWGSLVLHAAERHGVRCVGVTLSDAQAALARERIAQAGLSEQVEIRVCDYRQVADGPYDKIASVGMYEHVGRAELDSYVSHVHGLLRPGGLFLNHGIARLRQHPRGTDTFISRYIFPDGELHPVTDVMTSMESADLEIRDLESLREHYVLTLRRWLANLDARHEQAVGEVGEMRVRAWRLYLLGSAQAFASGEISVFQVLSARGGAPHELPLARHALLA